MSKSSNLDHDYDTSKMLCNVRAATNVCAQASQSQDGHKWIFEVHDGSILSGLVEEESKMQQ